MLEAARILHDADERLHFVLPLAIPRLRSDVDAGLTGHRLPLTIVERDRYLLYRGMTAALSASGTATLELALLGVPHVIVYRTSAATYRIGKRLARVVAVLLPGIDQFERGGIVCRIGLGSGLFAHLAGQNLVQGFASSQNLLGLNFDI